MVPFHLFVFVQSLRRVQLFATPWTAACQTFLSFTISQSLLKLMSIELVMPSIYSYYKIIDYIKTCSFLEFIYFIVNTPSV